MPTAAERFFEKSLEKGKFSKWFMGLDKKIGSPFGEAITWTKAKLEKRAIAKAIVTMKDVDGGRWNGTPLQVALAMIKLAPRFHQVNDAARRNFQDTLFATTMFNSVNAETGTYDSKGGVHDESVTPEALKALNDVLFDLQLTKQDVAPLANFTHHLYGVLYQKGKKEDVARATGILLTSARNFASFTGFGQFLKDKLKDIQDNFAQYNEAQKAKEEDLTNIIVDDAATLILDQPGAEMLGVELLEQAITLPSDALNKVTEVLLNDKLAEKPQQEKIVSRLTDLFATAIRQDHREGLFALGRVLCQMPETNAAQPKLGRILFKNLVLASTKGEVRRSKSLSELQDIAITEIGAVAGILTSPQGEAMLLQNKNILGRTFTMALHMPDAQIQYLASECIARLHGQKPFDDSNKILMSGMLAAVSSGVVDIKHCHPLAQEFIKLYRPEAAASRKTGDTTGFWKKEAEPAPHR